MSRAFYDLPTTTTRRSKYLLPGLTENKLKVFSIPKLMSSTYAQVASKDFVYTRTSKLVYEEASLTCSGSNAWNPNHNMDRRGPRLGGRTSYHRRCLDASAGE